MSKDDPSARRRRDPDQALLDAREVVRRHLAGESVREIAAVLGLSATTVHRTIQDYRRAKREADRDAEQGAVLAKLGGVLHCEDVTSPAQIAELNDLEYYRLRHLALDHPVRELWHEASAAGYKRPVREPVTCPGSDRWHSDVDASPDVDASEEW